jgi:CBS domain-containing protein
MRCEEVMTADVEYVYPDDTVEVAARKMASFGIGFLPVCSVAGRVVGTVTDRDLTIRVLAEGLPATTTVEEVMTHQMICVRASDEISRAEERMARHRKSRIICLDDFGRLHGVISLSDIAACEDDQHAGRILREVAGVSVDPFYDGPMPTH